MSCRTQSIYYLYLYRKSVQIASVLQRAHMVQHHGQHFDVAQHFKARYSHASENSAPSGTKLQREILGQRCQSISQGHTESQGFCSTSLTVRGGQLMVKVSIVLACPATIFTSLWIPCSSLTQSSGLSETGPYSLMPWLGTNPDLSNQHSLSPASVVHQ